MKLNPVFLREMRQAVRNRFVLYLMNIYLGGLLFFLLFETLATIDESQLGETLFWGLIAGMNAASIICVVGYTMGRTALDRINEDLMFTTTLTPGAIVRGKFLAGVLLSTLFYSATLPFLTIAYLLRGVDVWLIPLIFVSSFVALQMLNLICIAFFSGAKTFLNWALFFLPFLATASGIGGFLGLMMYFFVNEGISMPFYTLVYILLFIFCIFGIFFPFVAYFFGVAQLSPPSLNRMFQLRVFLTIFGVSAVLLAFIEHLLHDAFVGGYDSIIAAFPFLLLASVVLPLMSLIAICERPEYSVRQRQEIPKSKIWRLLAYPHFSGVRNGLFWLGCSIALLYIVTAILLTVLLPPSWNIEPNIVNIAFNFVTFFTFIFNYCVTALYLRNLLLSRFIPRHRIWIFALGLMFFAFVSSYLIEIALFKKMLNAYGNSSDFFELSLYHSYNPFTIFRDFDGYRRCQMYFAGAWFAIICVLSIPYQIEAFFPFGKNVYNSGA